MAGVEVADDAAGVRDACDSECSDPDGRGETDVKPKCADGHHALEPAALHRSSRQRREAVCRGAVGRRAQIGGQHACED
jgi:hypothetical protein